MRVKECVEIHRPIEDVWAFAADHANDPRWCTKVKSVEPAGSGRWKVMHRPIPLRSTAALTLEHLDAEPPRRLRLREEDDAAVFDVEYRLDPAEHGTLFTQVSDFRWKSLPRILHGAFARGVRHDVRAQLRELKRTLELSA